MEAKTTNSENSERRTMMGSHGLSLVSLISLIAGSGQIGGKGPLLVYESEDRVRERLRPYIRKAMLLIPIGVLVTTAGFVSRLFISVSRFTLLIPVMGGLIILLIGVTLLAIGRLARPTKIYENGIDVQVGKRTIFVSFGEFTRMRERMNPIEKEMYIVFEGTTPYLRTGVRKSLQGLDKILASIESKIGKPEHIVEIAPTQEEETASKRYEYMMYAKGPIMVAGMAMAITIPYMITQGSLGYYMFLDLLPLLPIAGMTVTVMAPVLMRRMKKLVPRKLNLKIPAAIIVGFLVTSLVIAAAGVGIFIAMNPPLENIGPKPSSTALAPGTYDGESLVVDGNVTVNSGEFLHIMNSVLTMDLRSDKEFGIWIEEGGTLTLENTTVTSDPRTFGYTFEIMGAATITESYITGLWGDPANVNYDGGLEIYSSDVLIENSHIDDVITNGLLIVNSDPVIINNTIEDAADDGIELQNSDARILNNTIEGCGWAIIVSRGSDAVIKGNFISDNRNGIVIESSSPIVEDNEFVRNSNYAIFYDNHSNPSFDGNVFTNNYGDISSGAFSFFSREVTTIISVIVAIISLYVIFRLHRKSVDEESGVQI